MTTLLARGLRNTRRLLSTQPPPPPPRFRRLRTAAKWTGILGVSSVIGVAGLGTAILVHDAFTYQDRHVDRVPVSPLALHPERGGPKNLPIARVQVDDEEDEENKRLAEKPRLIIVGGGWGVSSSPIIMIPTDARATGYGCTTETTSWRLSCHCNFVRDIHHVYTFVTVYVKMSPSPKRLMLTF